MVRHASTVPAAGRVLTPGLVGLWTHGRPPAVERACGARPSVARGEGRALEKEPGLAGEDRVHGDVVLLDGKRTGHELVWVDHGEDLGVAGTQGQHPVVPAPALPQAVTTPVHRQGRDDDGLDPVDLLGGQDRSPTLRNTSLP